MAVVIMSGEAYPTEDDGTTVVLSVDVINAEGIIEVSDITAVWKTFLDFGLSLKDCDVEHVCLIFITLFDVIRDNCR